MRSLKARAQLPANVVARLAFRSGSLMSSPDPSSICEQRFNNARGTQWFIVVREALMNMAGETRTCMFCDHNEPTDVEHFKPKVEFPEDTFTWDNMLWLCATCNRLKGVNFPPHNCPGAPMIDPVVDPVWNYFFLDEFGNLIKKWDAALGAYDERAQSTCTYALIDREEVQTRRLKRMKGLRISVEHAIGEFENGTLTLDELNNRVTDWLAEPFQADVADFHFRGPGTERAPFCNLLALGVVVPPP
jgi:hypothetical protein